MHDRSTRRRYPKDASADPQTESLTVNVTCEAAANCVYQPET